MAETVNDDAGRLAAFVQLIRQHLTGRATETQHEVDGYAWTWTHRGVWTLRAGSLLAPGVEITGPGCHVAAPPASLLGADLVLMVLQLADALPPAPHNSATATTYQATPSPDPGPDPARPWSTPPGGVPQLPPRRPDAAGHTATHQRETRVTMPNSDDRFRADPRDGGEDDRA